VEPSLLSPQDLQLAVEQVGGQAAGADAVA
jgi:hypothetical protein